VTAGNRAITVKRGRASDLGPALQVASFDTKTGDALSRWSARRSGHLAIANLPAALALRGTLWSSSGVGWVWNPYFGLFTFVPAQAVRSYLGYAYHSPGTAGEAAAGAIRKPKDPWPDGIHSFGYSVYAGRGYDAGDRGPGVAYGGVSAPSAGSANSPAAAPPVESPRSGDSATPRGSDGGGRGQ
jgi:hypothetical protein